MKKKKIRKLTKKILHIVGFVVSCTVVTVASGWAFLLFVVSESPTMNSAPEESLALVGVALGNNIGSGISRARDIPVNLPEDVIAVTDEVVHDGVIDEHFFGEHFSRIAQIEEIIAIDILTYLDAHEDRGDALDIYLQKLSAITKSCENARGSLTQLRDAHVSTLSNMGDTIKSKQEAIETAYNNRDGVMIEQLLVDLEELRITEQEHKHVQTFANRINQEYTTRINQAESRGTLVSANRDALVKGVRVELPTGAKLDDLQKLNLFTTSNN